MFKKNQISEEVIAMGWKTAIKVIGITVEIFSVVLFLSTALKEGVGQDQVLMAAIPYSFLAIAGVGIINVKQWGRYSVMAVSMAGMLQEIIELHAAFDLKDSIELSAYVAFIIFLTRNKVAEQFM